MKFRDGVDFTLGMTVIFESGREQTTDTENYVVEPFVFEGQTSHQLKLKEDAFMSIGLECLYSSQKARIADQVRILEKLKTKIDQEIEFLKNGGSPTDCHYLHTR